MEGPLEERNGEIEFRVVNNDGSRESMIILSGLKCLFQKQLPKMPKDYIARLVYDRTHLSIAIVKTPLEVIGGISYRELRDHNYATGYFQKQGFTKEITLDKTVWSPDMDELARQPRHGPHFTELRRFLYQIQNHKQAWPFLHPVNRDEVPDYYKVIESPMDLSTMEEKLEHDSYTTPKDLVSDLKLVFGNCQRYNDATTVYHKCAVRLEKHMWTLIKDIPEWFDLLEDD
ncbi:histone acetyltransferase [Neonectria magnoliae]|uniref:Histone acetyltransferase n=1 Tax=Neonectria magnoliae TaxID=2732573 RepID=A0ABR1IB05_9HYPO